VIKIFLTIDISFHELELEFQRCVFSRHSEDIGVDKKRIFKMYLREVGWRGMDWIDLSQDRSRCRALVNVVMNLRVS